MSQEQILPTVDETQLASSFRDPKAFVFSQAGTIYRYVDESGAQDLNQLHVSGLYDALVDQGLLTAHQKVPSFGADKSGITLLPEQVPYVSYPYEWSFSQLKAAALLTLEVQRLALKHGMSLKDASAYNVQFFGAQPRFIDTLSFESLDPCRPWVAYKQFCEHFLGPLALMSQLDVALAKLSLVNLDGVPLSLAAKLLPRRSLFNYSLLVHLHLHARSQTRHSDSAVAMNRKAMKMNVQMLVALNQSLRRAVERCDISIKRTEWSHYYDDTNYSDDAMDNKSKQIRDWLTQFIKPETLVHDVGANTGKFSAIAAHCGGTVIAHDIDLLAVERHYRALCDAGSGTRVLPLHLDFCNPSPAIGWGGRERDDTFSRCGHGIVLALALVHHLAIANNTPLANIAEQFARLGDKLIIEFVPKEDSQVQRLLASREDIFPHYTQAVFEQSFKRHFELVDKSPVKGSARTLYLYSRRSTPVDTV